MNHPAPSRAPREPLTLDMVEAALLHLMEAGKPPSEPNVRDLLGGSPNTIHPMIQRWFRERAPGLLAGRLSVVQSSDLPAAAHALVAELRDDARKAADEAVAGRLKEADDRLAEAAAAIADAKAKERALEQRHASLDDTLATLRTDLELARVELAAARASRDEAVAERREAIGAREAAESMLADAERRQGTTEAALAAANDTIAGLRAELDAKADALLKASARLGDKQAEIERAAADAAASMMALRESIDEIKAAHLREVQALRTTHAEAASRWAESRGALEKQIAALQADLRAHDSQLATADASLAKLAGERDALKSRAERAESALEARSEEASQLRMRTAELEKLVARMPDGVADLAKRLQSLEQHVAGATSKE